MELGLLLLRAVVGGLFIVRGTQRRYGSFDGMGRERTVGHFQALGYRDAGVVATIVTMTELVSGSLLVLGLLVPVAATAGGDDERGERGRQRSRSGHRS
ncbi:MAG: DoxX family membrane protein [Actinobacteria bacterium]|nr:DoxX family membrane protein [Actinomycetota bacterium]